MIDQVSKVKTAEQDEGWEYSISMPATFDEAGDVYGEETALNIFHAGLKVKLDNVAREQFRQGKSREEVEDIVTAYRPGMTTRRSVKVTALQLLTENAARLQTDADLLSRVTEAFTSGKFRDVVTILSEGAESEEEVASEEV